MRITKEEFDIFKKDIHELNELPEYIPTKEDLEYINEHMDQFLPYLYWVYVYYPRTGDKEENICLERIRPLLKNIHVRVSKK